jgi:hypothetical protein
VVSELVREIRFAWEYLMDVLRFLCREGCWSIDKIHADIIQAVLLCFEPNLAQCVRAQLEHRYFLSWMSSGRINVFFFYRPGCLPLLPCPEFTDYLFKVQLKIDGRRYRAQVTFYEGRIFSVEFKKPRKFFLGKEYSIGEVTRGEPKDTFTRTIDRAEHGHETDDNRAP